MSASLDYRSLTGSLGLYLPYALRQYLFAAAYAVVPRRLPGLLAVARKGLREVVLDPRPRIPAGPSDLVNPDGFCGFAGDISIGELVEGYRRGAFVMSHVGPLKWWTPRRRMVLFFDRACIEKSTRKLMRSGEYRVTFDTAFSLVIRECAALRPGKPPLTWITPRIIRLFEQAHAHGHAHSVEVWRDGQLVGGAYGLAVGDVFYTESQFHTARNASKLGFAVLNRHLQKWGFAFNDGKHVSRFLAGCGMLPVTRHEFSELAHCFGAKPRAPGRWTVEDDLCTGDWQPGQAQGLRMAGVMPQGTQCPETIDELLTTKRSPTW